MAKEKKLYAVKNEAGRVWKTELCVNTIKEIYHEGAGDEMCTDELIIEFNDYTSIRVDKIISE